VTGRAIVGWGAIALVLLSATGSRAQQAKGPSAERLRVVMVAAETERNATEDLIAAVESGIDGFDVDFAVEWVDRVPAELGAAIRIADQAGGEAGRAMVFWCDLADTEEVYLYLTASEQRRILVRRLDAAAGAGRAAAVAAIVRTVVGAVLRGGAIGVVVAPEPASGEPVAEQPADSASPSAGASAAEPTAAPEELLVRPAVQLAYDLRAHSPRQPLVHGFGLGLALLFQNGLELFAAHTFSAPIAIESRGIEIRLRTRPTTIGVGLSAELEPLRLGGALALIVDAVEQQTVALANPYAVGQDSRDVLVSLAPLLTVELRIFANLALFLRAGAQFDFTSMSYVAYDLQGRHELDRAWRFRPLAQIGVGIII
jgi:hypothetical protein